MKTEQFSKVEYLVETIRNQNDKLYDSMNILKQLPEMAAASIPSHIERDLNRCYNLLKDINDTIEVIQRCLPVDCHTQAKAIEDNKGEGNENC